MGTSVV